MSNSNASLGEKAVGVTVAFAAVAGTIFAVMRAHDHYEHVIQQGASCEAYAKNHPEQLSPGKTVELSDGTRCVIPSLWAD